MAGKHKRREFKQDNASSAKRGFTQDSIEAGHGNQQDRGPSNNIVEAGHTRIRIDSAVVLSPERQLHPPYQIRLPPHQKDDSNRKESDENAPKAWPVTNWFSLEKEIITCRRPPGITDRYPDIEPGSEDWMEQLGGPQAGLPGGTHTHEKEEREDEDDPAQVQHQPQPEPIFHLPFSLAQFALAHVRQPEPEVTEGSIGIALGDGWKRRGWTREQKGKWRAREV